MGLIFSGITSIVLYLIIPPEMFDGRGYCFSESKAPIRIRFALGIRSAHGSALGKSA